MTDAPAYGGSAPETCANCHVMDSQYENWYHAPHENFTECVDCHLPHENKVVYYLEKGRQGAKDVYDKAAKVELVDLPSGQVTEPSKSSKPTASAAMKIKSKRSSWVPNHLTVTAGTATAMWPTVRAALLSSPTRMQPFTPSSRF